VYLHMSVKQLCYSGCCYQGTGDQVSVFGQLVDNYHNVRASFGLG
jgi:hypothetical protein